MVSADRPGLLADGTSLAWALPAGLVLAVLVFYALRVVPQGERLVVLRFGRPVAVRRPGLAVVLPGVHRGVWVPLGATYVDILWLDAVTRDDVRVVVNGAALATVRDPVSYVLHEGSPGTATVLTAEEEIRGFVAKRDLAELAEPPEEDRHGLSAAISRRTRDWGVEVTFNRVLSRGGTARDGPDPVGGGVRGPHPVSERTPSAREVSGAINEGGSSK